MLEAENDHILKAQKGDNQSFGLLYDHYVKKIYRFIFLKVSSRQEAEDLTHEVFLSAWQKLPNFKIKGFPFSSWLYRIARNRVIDHYRTSKKHIDLDALGDTLEKHFLQDSENHFDRIDIDIDIKKIKKAISQLNENQQEIIQMRFIEDLSPKEISQILIRKEGTIRIIQHRAIEKIKKILDNQ